MDMRPTVDHALWFRGQPSETYALLPKIARDPARTVQDIWDRESRLLARFRERSLPYLPAVSASAGLLEQLFSMQHYGIDTRLLDWSENLLIAAYFATSSDRLGDDQANDPDSRPTIWTLDPVKWNEHVKALIDTPIEILTVADEASVRWAPAANTSESLAWRAKEPVAVYGTHNSPRIVAQRGAFTLHGTEMSPLDQMAAHEAGLAGVIRKYVYDGTCRELHQELSFVGFTESMIYPDLAHLARELQRMEGW